MQMLQAATPLALSTSSQGQNARVIHVEATKVIIRAHPFRERSGSPASPVTPKASGRRDCRNDSPALGGGGVEGNKKVAIVAVISIVTVVRTPRPPRHDVIATTEAGPTHAGRMRVEAIRSSSGIHLRLWFMSMTAVKSVTGSKFEIENPCKDAI
jgi:hypothetical protein